MTNTIFWLSKNILICSYNFCYFYNLCYFVCKPWGVPFLYIFFVSFNVSWVTGLSGSLIWLQNPIILFMILISMEFLLVSPFTAQFKWRAWTLRIRYRNEPCTLSMGFSSCLSAKKSLAENLYGKKDTPHTSVVSANRQNHLIK